MRLREVYKRSFVALPELLNGESSFEWDGGAPAGVAALLFSALEQAQYISNERMLELAALIQADLTEESARVGDGPEAPQVDGSRFVISIRPIMTTLAMGRHSDCYGWIHWSAFRAHDPTLRVNEGSSRLPPFDGAPAAMNRLCLGYFTEWTTCAFILARKFGGMDEWCRRILTDCVESAVDSSEAGCIAEGVLAVISIINWATDRGDPRAEGLTRALAAMYPHPGIDARTKAMLGILFSTSAGRWTHQSPQSWAREILRSYRQVLIEHEVVQLLCVAISSYAAWAASRDEVLREIRILANNYREIAADEDATVALEARVAIIQPLIFNLTEFGTTDDLIDVLWSWYGRDGQQRADGNVLFVGSAHGNGVGYVWPGGRHIVRHAAPAETLETLLGSLSGALHEYFRGPAGDRDLRLDERMVGAPAYDQASALIAAMADHYCIDQLAGLLPADWRPRSIVILPAHRDPLQATLAAALGWLAPLETSIEQPRPARAIRAISIWPGETQTTEAEVAFLRAVADQSGWEVSVADGPLNADAFRAYYEDADADLLWVIGHGQQSPFRMAESGLMLSDEQLLTASDIAGFNRPTETRRLLVLNICSASATQNRGGLARIGLAHDLTTADQLVIGHLWPIDYYAALAFGCALAVSLASHGPAEALRKTLSLMQRHQDLILHLSAASPDAEALDRLGSERASQQVENILSWGSAVLLT